MTKLYSLHHSHSILRSANSWYKWHWKNLTPPNLAQIENLLSELDQAIQHDDRTKADALAHDVEAFGKDHFKRSIFHVATELVLALALALALATLVRQEWFELYKIPTGSMRPSFEELDHLVVSKTAFGINKPLTTGHFVFEPQDIQRTRVIVFTTQDMDMTDTDSNYFWIFPAKKRLIKRNMGLPGDTLYFYGGRIYGMDRDGKDITNDLNPSWLDKVDHIPFMSFEGKRVIETLPGSSSISEIVLKQMNLPIGKLKLAGGRVVGSEVFNGHAWVTDDPAAELQTHDNIKTYMDLWGMKNFGIARLLTKDELKSFTDIDTTDLADAELYLEIRHDPSLTYPKPRFQAHGSELYLQLPPLISVIPLSDQHLKMLMQNMYTIRFVVKDGRATSYDNINGDRFGQGSPQFSKVPDGMYEFYYGKGYRVGWGGILYELPSDHPLYKQTPSNIQKLFNLGEEMHIAYMPYSKNQLDFPSRYVYFRDGDLYVMGAPLLKREDPTLVAFNTSEERRQAASNKTQPYTAFKDHGAPLKDGALDKEFLTTFGLKIPEKQYLMLGDNHARSGDSRVFGFVSEENLQGSPSLLLWPPGPRWGIPLQPSGPWINVSTLIIWGIVALVVLAWWQWSNWRMHRPTFRKLS